MKRWTVLLLALLLCLGPLSSVPAHAVGEVYFTALNDSILPLTWDTMPGWSGGVLYAPYTVFDSNTTGINLSLNCSYDRGSGLVTVYNLQRMIVFDLAEGNCYDPNTGTFYQAKSVVMNGKPYLPVSTVCSLFGLSYSYLSTDYGYLVRIKSASTVLSDDRFIDAASSQMSRRLREYNQSLSPAPSPEPGDQGSSQVEDGTHSQTPSQPETPEVPTSHTRFFMGISCSDGAYAAQMADALDSAGATAVFFFTPQQLTAQGDLVRRLISTGHSVGLLVEGETSRAVESSLAEGTQALTAVAQTPLRIVLCSAGASSAVSRLGYAVWDTSCTLSPSSSTSARSLALRAQDLLAQSGGLCLTLEESQTAARLLPSLLSQLDSAFFSPMPVMETLL